LPRSSASVGFFRRWLRRDPEAWFREAILFYRRIGWWMDWAGLSEEELLREARREYREHVYGDPELGDPDPSLPFAELDIMALDDERAWWEDTEADVSAGNQVYSDLLPVLGRMSRGTVAIQDVVETWASEEGPITVEFTANGIRRTIRPEYHDDWIGPEPFEAFQELLRPTPYRLYTFNTQGQDFFCAVLSKSEVRLIREERGLALKKWTLATRAPQTP